MHRQGAISPAQRSSQQQKPKRSLACQQHQALSITTNRASNFEHMLAAPPRSAVPRFAPNTLTQSSKLAPAAGGTKGNQTPHCRVTIYLGDGLVQPAMLLSYHLEKSFALHRSLFCKAAGGLRVEDCKHKSRVHQQNKLV